MVLGSRWSNSLERIVVTELFVKPKEENEKVVIAISNGLKENFYQLVEILGISVGEVPEPDDWMDRITDNAEDRKILKDILSATDCPVKFTHFEMDQTDYNFLRLNLNNDYKKL